MSRGRPTLTESKRAAIFSFPSLCPSLRPPNGVRAETVECSVIRLDQVRPRRPGLERVAEVLRLAGHLSVAEFHDAHGVRRYAVIAEDQFGDPEIAAADDPLDCEALLARLHRSALLDVVSAANAFARLRI